MIIKKHEDTSVLTPDEVLDIYKVDAFKASLVECLQQSNKVKIDLSAVSSIDLTAMQLLFSAKKSARQAGKIFQTYSPSQAVQDTCAALGIRAENLLEQEADVI